MKAHKKTPERNWHNVFEVTIGLRAPKALNERSAMGSKRVAFEQVWKNIRALVNNAGGTEE